MTLDRLDPILEAALAALGAEGRRKGAERVVTAVVPPREGRGPRYRLAGHGDREFLRMNSNSYLGLSRHPAVLAAAEAAARRFGAGPGAVRFISGTLAPHVALEEGLARFHGRDAALLFSAAYAAVIGVLPPLVTPETLVVSDALNHNCIINAVRLARPGAKEIYPHLDVERLGAILAAGAGKHRRAVVVTDGVFSMRGDHAPLAAIRDVIGRAESGYPEGILLVVDDSHGVGALGESGRGTEEEAGGRADLLVATLGKAFGVNGGYAVSTPTVIAYLRETSPCYVYSNPISPAEAAAAGAVLGIVEGEEGRALLARLRVLTRRLRDGLAALGLETLPGAHPIVPLLVRDTAKARRMAAALFDAGILVTPITYPVVPRGEEELRFQVAADHTERDIDEVLAALARLGVLRD